MRSIFIKTLLPILCLCTALCAGTLPVESTHAQSTLIHLSPVQAQVGEEQTTAVEVRVENVEALYGLDIRLSFDPSVVEVVDADPAAAGLQVRPGGLLSLDFVLRNTADNEQGTAWFALTQVNPSQEVSGSGIAFIVTFAGKSAGSSTPLSITYAKIVERTGAEIPASTEDGTISVVAPEQAPATPTQAPPPPQPTVVTPTPTPSQPTTPADGTPVATATIQPTQQAPTDTATPTWTSSPTQSSPTETPTAPAPTETLAPGQTPVAAETQPTPASSSSTVVPTSTPTAVSVAEAGAAQAQPTQASPSSSAEESPEASGWASTLLVVTSIAGILGAVLLIAGIVGIIRLARQQSR